MLRLAGLVLGILGLSSSLPLQDGTSLSERSTAATPNGAATPLPPSQDPWYSPPAAWEQTAPGSVLKVRAAPLLRYTIGNALSAWHILFRTTNSSRGATWAVTTLFVPARHYRCNPAERDRCGHALLSYQTPYDSASVDASPSYALRQGEPYAAYGEISEALFRGWFVSVPDYEGPDASYTAGVMSGLATIDSVRAVLASAGNWGMRSADSKVTLFGYSGGALASEFAAGE
jgi:secretory lipase